MDRGGVVSSPSRPLSDMSSCLATRPQADLCGSNGILDGREQQSELVVNVGRCGLALYLRRREDGSAVREEEQISVSVEEPPTLAWM